MAVARELVTALYTDSNGRLVLREHRGDFYRWNQTCWREVDRRDVRRAAYEWLEDAIYQHKKDGMVPFDPSRRKIDDVMDALRAAVLLDSTVEAPCWINDTTDPPADELISIREDVARVLKEMPLEVRAVCEILKLRSVNATAESLGIPRTTLLYRLEPFRERLAEEGISEIL